MSLIFQLIGNVALNNLFCPRRFCQHMFLFSWFFLICTDWYIAFSHWGSFAQNSFQIDSINSCTTSKKLQFWLKIVGIIYFLTLKPIKGKLGFSLEIMEKNTRWRHKSEISKRNAKTMISPPLGMAWVSKEAVWST